MQLPTITPVQLDRDGRRHGPAACMHGRVRVVLARAARRVGREMTVEAHWSGRTTGRVAGVNISKLRRDLIRTGLYTYDER